MERKAIHGQKRIMNHLPTLSDHIKTILFVWLCVCVCASVFLLPNCPDEEFIYSQTVSNDRFE